MSVPETIDNSLSRPLTAIRRYAKAWTESWQNPSRGKADGCFAPDSGLKADITCPLRAKKTGDGLALRLCIERLLPPRRDRPVEFKLSKLETAADAAKALSDILQAVAAGELTPSEAEALGTLVAGYSRAIEIVDLEERVTRLENRRAA